MDEYTEISRLAMTNIPKLILAVICSFASKLLSQENDTLAKATEEILQAYKELDTEKINEETPNANSIQLFDKNMATDSSLSPIDKAVYSVLCALAKPETTQCSPKVETIATHASCSQRAVYRSLNTLEAIGAIQRTSRFRSHRQISSIYKITGCKTSGDSDTEIKHSAETKHPVDNTDYHSSVIADKPCPANEQTPCHGITMPACQTVVSVPDCQAKTVPTCQGEKTL